MESEAPDDDLTLTSPSQANESDAVQDPSRADAIAQRVLEERDPLPFRTRYPLGGSIGKGGMAEVFLARDRVLNRVVAVKMMRGFTHDEVQLRRFLREAQITAQLSHPNVVPVHALENDGMGRPSLVMKCIEGKTVKRYLEDCRARQGTRDLDSGAHGVAARLEHLVKVCDAIAFAHSLGVLHRDLKPANVMIGRFGQVYVMDWGIAAVLGASEDAKTGPGAGGSGTSGLHSGIFGFAGTPMYMPPEQVGVDGREAGPAADQYALGMMLYEMLTLQVPRDGVDTETLVEQARTAARRPFGGAPVPAALRAVVERATSAEPADRYPSVAAFAADLRRFLRNEELEAYPDNIARKAWRGITRHPVRAMAVLLLVLAAAATTSILSLRHALQATKRSLSESEILSDLVARVSEFVHEKDQRAKGVETLVESLAVEVEGALRGPEAPSASFLAPADLGGADAPSDTAYLARYRQRVTFAAPVVVRAPDHDAVRAGRELGRLREVPRVFRSLFERSLLAVEADPTRQGTLAVLRERAPLAYAYVGMQSGILLNYPGGDTFPPDYDPRKRPWYQRADAAFARWGAPYPGASGSGFLVPCNRQVRGPDGFAGVVGVDVSLDHVLQALRVAGLPHQRRAILVDGDAMIVATESDMGRTWGVGTHGDREKEREPLGVPELAVKLREGAHNGVYRRGGSLFVFSRLMSLGWTLVVEFDAEPILRL